MLPLVTLSLRWNLLRLALVGVVGLRPTESSRDDRVIARSFTLVCPELLRGSIFCGFLL